MEISLVSIPASSSSAFSVVKSLGEDTGLYTGDFLDVESADEVTEDLEEIKL